MDADQYAQFVRVLDQPVRPSKQLRQLFESKSPWET
jgi:uncharacterized protein (DUF1778 family)